jgi:TonB-dependent starch-binding outer membrane protein SusC
MKQLITTKKSLFKFDLKMKLTLFLLFTSILSLQANVTYSQKILVSLDLNNVSVSKFIDEIESKTDFRFVYKIKEVDLNRTVTIKANKEKITTVLDKVFGATQNTYTIIDKQIFLNKKTEITPKKVGVIEEQKDQQQQQLIITGKVTQTNGISIYGANINIEGEKKGVSTEIDGSYKIEVSSESTVLVYSYIGFTSKKVIVGSQRIINIILAEAVNKLEEVVLVGYGQVKRKDLTGSVSSINGDDLNVQPISSSFDQKLGGLLTGVAVTQISGRPGAGAVINIRGASSIRGANQPLYIIDGVPVLIQDEVSSKFERGELATENPLLSINPADIESVDVLKDASATAIYGSRAANGLIIVKTKSGKKKQAGQLNISVTNSIQYKIKELDLMNATQYKKYITKVAENTNAFVLSDNNPFNDFNPDANTILTNDRGGSATVTPYFGTSNTDWSKLLLRNAPVSQSLSANFQGGTESTTYYVGGNYNKEEGMTFGDDFQNIGIRVNLTSEISKKWTLGANFSYNRSTSKSLGETLFAYSAIGFQPTLAPFNEDGSYTSYPSPFGGRPSFVPNANLEIENKNTGQNFSGNVSAEYKITKNLSIKSNYNAAVQSSDSRTFRPSFLLSSENLSLSKSEVINTTLANTLDYTKTFADKHTVKGLLGMSLENRELSQTTIAASGINNNILNSLSSATTILAKSESKQLGRLNSYFTRWNYDFDKRYYLTITARTDGSTKFGPNNKWGVFPSGALMWNLSNESFLKGNSTLSDLKLRGSMGVTGLANIPEFQYRLAYQAKNGTGNDIYAGGQLVVSNGIVNPDVKWETTTQTDLALEFGLFRNQVRGGVTYYTKKTNGLLLFAPISPTTGSTSQILNVADMTNKGLEVELSLDLKLGQVKWTSGFNVAFNKNVLDKLNGGSLSQFGNPGSIQEGSELGTLYGYVVEGIFQNQQQIKLLNKPFEKNPPEIQTEFYQDVTGMQVGAYKYRDLNGDGKITTADQKVHGSTQPKYFGGWNNNIKYKGFELVFNVQFVQGAKKAWGDVEGSSLNRNVLDSNKIVGVLENAWSPENSNALYESAIFSSATSRNFAIERTSVLDREVFDASYVRLKTVRINYGLPKPMLGKIGIRSLDLNFTLSNVWTYSKWPGLDPESITSRDNSLGFVLSGQQLSTVNSTYSYNAIPLTRSFAIGLNIGL